MASRRTARHQLMASPGRLATGRAVDDPRRRAVPTMRIAPVSRLAIVRPGLKGCLGDLSLDHHRDRGRGGDRADLLSRAARRGQGAQCPRHAAKLAKLALAPQTKPRSDVTTSGSGVGTLRRHLLARSRRRPSRGLRSCCPRPSRSLSSRRPSLRLGGCSGCAPAWPGRRTSSAAVCCRSCPRTSRRGSLGGGGGRAAERGRRSRGNGRDRRPTAGSDQGARHPI